MTLSIAGALVGGLMTRPTSEQLHRAAAAHAMPVAGAHTVGAPDGGHGLPITGWSSEHGDFRVPHFAGLHAMQGLPFVALLLPRSWSEQRRTRIVIAASASYAATVLILLAQAFAGESIGSPSSPTIVTIAACTIISVTALWFLERSGSPKCDDQLSTWTGTRQRVSS